MMNTLEYRSREVPGNIAKTRSTACRMSLIRGVLLCVAVIALAAGDVWAQGRGTPWVRHEIDNSTDGADGARLTDVNGDGLMDIATGWEEGGAVRAYLHPGHGAVTSNWPAVTVGSVGDVEDAVFVDLDGDGAIDVISCAEGGTQGVFVHWAPTLPADYLDPAEWQTAMIPASSGLQWMYAVPMQVDGADGIDIVAGAKLGSAKVSWFESPATNPRNLSQWVRHDMSGVDWTMSLIDQDMDADGDLDIIVTDRFNGAGLQGARWLENPGTGLPAQENPWTNHWIGAQGEEAMLSDMADLDNDGLTDLVVPIKSSPMRIATYRRTHAVANTWVHYPIDTPPNVGTPKGAGVGDIDLDGDPDIVLSFANVPAGNSGVVWISYVNSPFTTVSYEETYVSLYSDDDYQQFGTGANGRRRSQRFSPTESTPNSINGSFDSAAFWFELTAGQTLTGTLSLYVWNTDYSTTIAGEVITSKSVSLAGPMDDFEELTFAAQEADSSDDQYMLSFLVGTFSPTGDTDWALRRSDSNDGGTNNDAYNDTDSGPELKTDREYQVRLNALTETVTPAVWEDHEISGTEGVKFDLVALIDLDGDTDLDVITTEEQAFGEGLGLGLVWYENPFSIPNPCQKPSLNGAISRKTHGGGAGDYDIELYPYPTAKIECRSAQAGSASTDLKVIATFDIDVAVLGDEDAVQSSQGTVTSVQPIAGEPTKVEIDITGAPIDDAITLTFGDGVHGIVDATCPTDPTAASTSQLCVRILVGDYGQDGTTNFEDFASIRTVGHLNQAVSGDAQARADFDCSGEVNFIDFAKVTNAGLIDQTAPACQ